VQLSVLDKQPFINILSLLFEGIVGIVGEGIVVGAFVVIAVNTMIRARIVVMVSDCADTEVSTFVFVGLTNVCSL